MSTLPLLIPVLSHVFRSNWLRGHLLRIQDHRGFLGPPRIVLRYRYHRLSPIGAITDSKRAKEKLSSVQIVTHNMNVHLDHGWQDTDLPLLITERCKEIRFLFLSAPSKCILQNIPSDDLLPNRDEGLPEGKCDKEGARTTLNKAVTCSRRQQPFNTP